MNNLLTFKDFIITESSKNDPIAELNIFSKLGIILLGAPGIGKSTFVREFIHPRNPNIKVFSTDDVSLKFTKDPKIYHETASELNLKRLFLFIETGQSFIYDTTGTQEQNIISVYKKSKELGYTTIFIHLVGSLDTAISGNISRERQVPIDYLVQSYKKQWQSMSTYSKLNPDGYYVVDNTSGKYKFYKYDLSGLSKRKVDRYEPMVKESTDNNIEVDNIVETMLDFIDEGERITFKSSTGDMTYTDYLQKNAKYSKFRPVISARGATTSKFSIVYAPKDGSYNNLMVVLDNMQSTIGRLGELGWSLSDFKVKSNRNEGKLVTISSVSFEFSKPFVRIDTDDVELPNEDELREQIESFGIGINRLEIGDYDTELEFFSHSYDGSLHSEQFYDETFEKICDIFGFSSYDLDYQSARVTFEY